LCGRDKKQLESRLQGQVVDTYRIRSVCPSTLLQSGRGARRWGKVSAKPQTSHHRDPLIGQIVELAGQRWCWFVVLPSLGKRAAIQLDHRIEPSIDASSRHQ